MDKMIQWLKNYLVSPTHKWWVENIWRPTWTKLLTAIYGIPAAIVAAFEGLSSLANDTTVGSYLSQLNVPEWVSPMLAGIALMHYIASGRKK